MTIKGWLVNDTLSCIHGVRTLWHNLLEWFPNLEDKTNGYTDYSILAEVIENDIHNTVKKPEYIIRNVDSYNQIFHTYVGRPFPITVDSKYSSETQEIDIRKEMAKTVSENIKDKREDEHKTMQEIKQKEEENK